MKKTILISIAPLILLLLLGAQKSSQLDKFTKLSDKTYLYNFEVSVEEYYQFLKANNFDINLLPDTSVFKDKDTFGDQIIPIGFSEKYFSSEYNQYPIVGITSSQAEKYCQWMLSSGKMNSEVKEVRLPNLNEFFSALYHQPIEVEFRKEDDSKFIRTNNLDENHWTDLCHIDLSKTLSKGVFTENLSGMQDSYVHICPVRAYSNNGMNNLLGNVSELVYIKQKGSMILPIGNNFSGNVSYMGKLSNPSYLTWDDSLIASKDQWNKPSAKIGFRYIIVLK